MHKLIYLLFLILPSTALVAGGGWTQPKNIGFFKLSEWWIIADQHYTDTGEIDPNITNGIFNTSFYGEFGLSKRWTIQAYIPLVSRVYYNNLVSGTTGDVITPGEGLTSLGDPEIALTYGLIQKAAINISATIKLGIPLGEDQGGSQMNLQTGDGEFNQIIRIDMGKSYSLLGMNAYASTYFGFNNRTNGFSDEYRFGLETGFQLLNEKLWIILRIAGVQSRKNGLENFRENSTSLFANNAEHFSYLPEVSYMLNKNWGVSAGMGGAFSGKLIYARPSYSFGIFYKMN